MVKIINVKILNWMYRMYDGLDDDLIICNFVVVSIVMDMVCVLLKEGVKDFYFYIFNCLELIYVICYILGVRFQKVFKIEMIRGGDNIFIFIIYECFIILKNFLLVFVILSLLINYLIVLILFIGLSILCNIQVFWCFLGFINRLFLCVLEWLNLIVGKI